MSHSKNNSDLGFYWPYIAFIVVLVLVSGGVGFFLGRYLNAQVRIGSYSLNTPQPGMVKISPLFRLQTAVIQGKVTSVNNSSLTVSDSNSNTENFPIGKNFVVYTAPPDSGPGYMKTTYDIKDILLNKEASISLQVQDSQYKVISITYLNPPTTASASAKKQ